MSYHVWFSQHRAAVLSELLYLQKSGVGLDADVLFSLPPLCLFLWSREWLLWYVLWGKRLLERVDSQAQKTWWWPDHPNSCNFTTACLLTGGCCCVGKRRGKGVIVSMPNKPEQNPATSLPRSPCCRLMSNMTCFCYHYVLFFHGVLPRREMSSPGLVCCVSKTEVNTCFLFLRERNIWLWL